MLDGNVKCIVRTFRGHSEAQKRMAYEVSNQAKIRTQISHLLILNCSYGRRSWIFWSNAGVSCPRSNTVISHTSTEFHSCHSYLGYQDLNRVHRSISTQVMSLLFNVCHFEMIMVHSQMMNLIFLLEHICGVLILWCGFYFGQNMFVSLYLFPTAIMLRLPVGWSSCCKSYCMGENMVARTVMC